MPSGGAFMQGCGGASNHDGGRFSVRRAVLLRSALSISFDSIWAGVPGRWVYDLSVSQGGSVRRYVTKQSQADYPNPAFILCQYHYPFDCLRLECPQSMPCSCFVFSRFACLASISSLRSIFIFSGWWYKQTRYRFMKLKPFNLSQACLASTTSLIDHIRSAFRKRFVFSSTNLADGSEFAKEVEERGRIDIVGKVLDEEDAVGFRSKLIAS